MTKIHKNRKYKSQCFSGKTRKKYIFFLGVEPLRDVGGGNTPGLLRKPHFFQQRKNGRKKPENMNY